jgi:hypothetical protein
MRTQQVYRLSSDISQKPNVYYDTKKYPDSVRMGESRISLFRSSTAHPILPSTSHYSPGSPRYHHRTFGSLKPTEIKQSDLS